MSHIKPMIVSSNNVPHRVTCFVPNNEQIHRSIRHRMATTTFHSNRSRIISVITNAAVRNVLNHIPSHGITFQLLSYNITTINNRIHMS